ncbi:4566_t:CDS:2 [Acaulospora morrowiae]|uniref:4566_t:CDS:1 n=1 Tax=Acaulospora morrowiae TaxID=94023 RepID=A0A9N9BSV4_9GLOM|nr:4566_t:CDS:2 [Acaulospora morrowiae]
MTKTNAAMTQGSTEKKSTETKTNYGCCEPHQDNDRRMDGQMDNSKTTNTNEDKSG